MKNEWKKYLSEGIIYKGSNCFWQKLIKRVGEEKIFVELVEWEYEEVKSYELSLQIDQSISITGLTINVNNFNYDKLDFKLAERHAKAIIKGLIK